ncbi:transposable element Tcb2 transposase [Trichonephila clavipes]|nr:transposable element Tcb2 transposase [Trichonephila clavipes]
MRVWKQWTDEHRTTRKTGNGRRKVTSVCNDRHLLGIAVNDRTAFSRQLAARWSTTTGVLMSASSIRRRLLHRGLRARVPLYRIPLTANHRRLRLQWAHEHRAWQAVWHQVVFSGVPGAIFQRNNARPHVAKTARDFCSAQHMQLLSCPAYSPDMSPIEHVWDLVGRCLARDPRPAASKDELLLRIQAIWNSLPQADIQNLFDCFPHRCDHGFGHLLAKKLDSEGFYVYASCLFPSGPGAVELKQKSSNRLKILGMDVTSDESVLKAVKFVEEDLKPLSESFCYNNQH